MAHALEGIVTEVGKRGNVMWAEVAVPHVRFGVQTTIIVPGAGLTVGRKVLIRIIPFDELSQEEQDVYSSPDAT